MKISVLFFSLLFFQINVFTQPLCNDTARKDVLFISNDTSLLIKKVIPFNNNKVFIGSAFSIYNGSAISSPVIFAINKQNKILWSKFLPNAGIPINLTITDVIALNNGNICVTGIYGGPYSSEIFLFTFSGDGVILFTSRFNINVPNQGLPNVYLTNTIDNKIAILVIHPANIVNSLPQYWFTLMKCDLNGVPEWSVAYSAPESFKPSGIVSIGGDLFIHYEYWINSNGFPVSGLNYAQHLMKFDSKVGNLVSNKTFYYTPPNPLPADWGTANGNLKEPSFYASGENSLIAFSSDWGGGIKAGQNISFFDTLLNIINSVRIQDTSLPYSIISHADIDNESQILITGNNSSVSQQGFGILLDKNLKIVEQKKISYMAYTPPGTNSYKGAIPLIQNNRSAFYNASKITSAYEIEIIDYPFFFDTLLSCIGPPANEIEIKNSPLISGGAFFTFRKRNHIIANQQSVDFTDANIKSLETCISIIERSLSVTKDTSICKGDSVVISANKHFTHYEWPVKYRFLQLTDSSIKVFPDKDTSYIVRAYTSSGCMLTDTVFIKVNRSYPINLGNDTTTCKGDSIRLALDNFFLAYNWNTGSTLSSIVIKQPGIYNVIATNTNGCYSTDTLEIFPFYDTPFVAFNNSAVLCIKQTDILDAGNYASYLWQDGSNNKTYTVTSKGIYSVRVTDMNGCKGLGSVKIDSLVYPPTGFLPVDTAICNYQTIQLQSASNTFQTYLWNTGNTNSTINITSPATYSLTVSDKYGCIGKDTTDVQLKNCPNSIFFPTAFTPDNNGLNDLFKPLVEGALLFYELTIYNRWGQEVFRTTDAAKGWNGIYKNQPQNPGSFLWICTFQFRGERKQTNKGTVYLIR